MTHLASNCTMFWCKTKRYKFWS